MCNICLIIITVNSIAAYEIFETENKKNEIKDDVLQVYICILIYSFVFCGYVFSLYQLSSMFMEFFLFVNHNLYFHLKCLFWMAVTIAVIECMQLDGREKKSSHADVRYMNE